MKIQITALKNGIVSSDGVTGLFGIAFTGEEINDFDTKFINLCMTNGKPSIRLIESDKNIRKMDEEAYGYSNEYADINHYLKLSVWQSFSGNGICGEVAFLKTEFPGEKNAYIIFGLAKSPVDDLNNLSGVVLQADLPCSKYDRLNNYYPLAKTNISAEHERGSSIANVLRNHVWGCGEEKLGLRSFMVLSEAKKMHELTDEFMRTGVKTKEMNHAGISTDKEYMNYRKELDKRGFCKFVAWETEIDALKRDSASSEILREANASKYASSSTMEP